MPAQLCRCTFQPKEIVDRINGQPFYFADNYRTFFCQGKKFVRRPLRDVTPLLAGFTVLVFAFILFLVLKEFLR